MRSSNSRQEREVTCLAHAVNVRSRSEALPVVHLPQYQGSGNILLLSHALSDSTHSNHSRGEPEFTAADQSLRVASRTANNNNDIPYDECS